MKKYICSNNIHVDEIVKELYDFSKLGGVSIPNALTEEACNDFITEIAVLKYRFQRVQRVRGRVVQEMETFYIENANTIVDLPDLNEKLSRLQDEYLELYEKIGALAGFKERFNSVGLHFYGIGSAGITPHQDFAAGKYLIASFVLSGNAPFFVCADRKKTNSVELPSDPGSIVLLRAARTEEEQRKRPFHYVPGPMEMERYSILIRTETKK